MRLLLDSHTLLWNINDDSRLSSTVRFELERPKNRLVVSLASLWELGIKHAQGRLILSGTGLDFILEFMERWRIELLPVTLQHVRAAGVLPFHHGDPFDRMLIAQAKTESLRFVSNDAKIRLYDVDVFW